MTLSEMSATSDVVLGTRGGQLTRDDRARLFRFMAMMRAAEERGLALYKQGKVPGSFYDGCGQEAVSVGAAYALGPRDRMCILHRDLGAHFVRGVTPDRYLGNYMGRSGGVTGGKDGNMHFGDPRLGCVGMVSMLPDMALPAVGMALAFKMRGEARVAMTFFGEGSTANGQWHEAMNFAGIHRLPAVFMLENNQFAYSTPNELEFAVDPVKRAEGYGFAGVDVDGNDVEAVFDAAAEAVDRARTGGGPTLIECRTMRMHGHGAHDDMSYVPPEMLEHWKGRDPIDLYSGRLVAEHGFSEQEVEAIREEVREYVAECASEALDSPMPEPELGLQGVFADGFEPLGDGQAPVVEVVRERKRKGGMSTASQTSAAASPGTGTREMTYLEAISDALRTEMRRDETVFCLGEDIGAFGGAFKVTDGFAEEFGADRVLDTPLAENLIIGAAVGAAVEGMRPVCEMQFADFIACGFDQLVNVAAKLHYRQGVAVPMVVRLPSGGASRAARFTRKTRRPGCCSRPA